ncbi:MAG TPA: hypothetical protein VFE78_36000, partial [Gemmataceae bacterium]|nr:hypothetical protein [Gemmataceae bacterium]
PAAGQARLTLADEKLPLQEIRPLDRHVWVLTLEATWQRPPTFGVPHYVNLLFSNGTSSSHRVLDEALFRAGEVRCLLPQYQLIRGGVDRGGAITIVISAGRAVRSARAAEAISAPFEVRWPMDRPVVRLAPRTRHTPPPEIDAMPLPGEMPAVPVPPVRRLPVKPAPLPPPTPDKLPPPKPAGP